MTSWHHLILQYRVGHVKIYSFWGRNKTETKVTRWYLDAPLPFRAVTRHKYNQSWHWSSSCRALSRDWDAASHPKLETDKSRSKTLFIIAPQQTIKRSCTRQRDKQVLKDNFFWMIFYIFLAHILSIYNIYSTYNLRPTNRFITRVCPGGREKISAKQPLRRDQEGYCISPIWAKHGITQRKSSRNLQEDMMVSSRWKWIHIIKSWPHMGVSKNRGTPEWMVYKFIMENPIKMDDLGVPLF